MRSKCACGWDREKDLKHTNEVETAASRLSPLASVSFNGDDHPPEPSPPRMGTGRVSSDAVVSESCVRIWGGRPYQPKEDNDMEACEHWRKITAASPPLHEGRDLVTKVLRNLHALNPGHGPGLPAHLPVSLREFESVGVKKICCGERIIAFLTETKEVYTMGVACHGELGQGDKIHMSRTPKRVSFPRKRPLSQEIVNSEACAQSRSVSMPDEPPLDPTSPAPARGLPPAVEVEIVDIACGAHHVLALSSEGQIYVWGDRRCCGLLTLHDLRVPTVMDANLLSTSNVADATDRVVAIGAGYNLSVAIKEDGSFFVWGALAGLARCSSPKCTGVFINANESEYKVTCGRNFGLLLQGDNVYQFGYGTMNEILQISPKSDGKEGASAAGKPTDQRDLFFKSTEDIRYRAFCPQWISGRLKEVNGAMKTPVDIAAGEHHALLLTRDGSIFAWGSNQWGQCGVGINVDVIRVPSMVATKVVATMIAASARTSGFIDDSGRLYLWGCSSNHRLINSSIEQTLELPLIALTNQTVTTPMSAIPTSNMGVATQSSRHDSVLAPQLVTPLASYKVVRLAFGPNFTVTVSSGAQKAASGT